MSAEVTRSSGVDISGVATTTPPSGISFGVAFATSRRSTNWRNTKAEWGQIVRKLSTPIVTPESVAEYHAMTHDQQASIKDVGGFVGGIVQGGRRVNGSVPFRQIMALDLDNGKLEFKAMAYELSGVWEFAYLLHTTRSYTNLTPRYRIVIPLSRPVDAVEYEAVGRYLASLWNINEFDPTTFQQTRLMYFPSRSSDGYFNAEERKGGMLDVDKVLGLYSNPRDPQEWPYGANDSPKVARELATVQDPLEKEGVVGAFCRAYPIREVLEVMLSEYYKPESNGRYTYIGGSSSGGVVVYEDKWCYSHHSTDPNREQLLNAFDLYRLVRFGALDTGTNTRTSIDNRPSYRAMVEWCNKDERVQRFTVTSEARDLALFANYEPTTGGGVEEVQEEPDDQWLIDMMVLLDKHPKSGKIECSLKNYATIIDQDPNVVPNLVYDTFTEKVNVRGRLPWEREKSIEWSDSDDASFRVYIDKVYGIQPNKGYYDDAFTHVMMKSANRIDSGLEVVMQGEWDGVPRAEELFITTMGVDDTELNRQQTLIWLKAIVARQLEPGAKFDNMLILSGEESLGKSTLFRLLVGNRFFSDSFNFGWKSQQLYEALSGRLIVESSDLDGFDKKEAESVKSFLSSNNDVYRKPYARRTSSNPRRCVFAGSTNQVEVLKSQTGNRRMWIMRCNKERVKVRSWELLTPDYVAQIWAEVRTKYQEDNRLYLTPELVELQKEQQLEFTQTDPLADEILQYCKIWLPSEWSYLSINERIRYITAYKQGNPLPYTASERRTTVSAVEFIREWMCYEVDQKTQYLAKQVNTAIRTLKGFSEGGQIRDGAYGRLRTFTIPKEVNEVQEFCINNFSTEGAFEL